MPNWFNRVQKLPHVQRSVYHYKPDYKTSSNIGTLVPTLVEECLPSDKVLDFKVSAYVRFAPLMFPLMHRIKMNTHNFFVPTRIILGDDLYEKFLNNQVDLVPAYCSVAVEPIEANPFIETIFDFLGYDIYGASVQTIGEDPDYKDLYTLTLDNPIPYIGYYMIVRDWFLDSQLQADWIQQVDDLVEGYRAAVAAGTSFKLWDYDDLPDFLDVPFQVNYNKDYFNTARPAPQLGSDMYVLNRPLEVSSPGVSFGAVQSKVIDGQNVLITTSGVGDSVKLTEETSIRDLWRKEALQMWEQHGNSFGSRVREQLAAHYGVIISDKRLQIPQWCGSSHSYVQISEVIQNSATIEGESPLGAFAGKGSGVTTGYEHGYFCEEHGFYICLFSLVPDNGYTRGEQRFYLKKNIFDFAFPEFNNVGWQEIYNAELYKQGGLDAEDNMKAFGYQPRYSEYRHHASIATGAFRTPALLGWHLNRNFESLPVLNEFFPQIDKDAQTRVFNYDGTGACFLDIEHDYHMSRPISQEPDSFHIY